MRTFATLLLAVALACRSDPVPSVAPPSATAPPPPVTVVASGSTPRVADAEAAPSEPPHRLSANGCSVNEDCVLTAEAAGCCRCPFDHEYPALKRAADAHMASCVSADCKVPTRCPPVGRYDPAFDRAECRSGRCVVVRWHGGG